MRYGAQMAITGYATIRDSARLGVLRAIQWVLWQLVCDQSMFYSSLEDMG